MKLNDLDAVHVNTARPLPAFPSAPGWRGAVVALPSRLVKAWIGLYAAAPQRPLPPL